MFPFNYTNCSQTKKISLLVAGKICNTLLNQKLAALFHKNKRNFSQGNQIRYFYNSFLNQFIESVKRIQHECRRHLWYMSFLTCKYLTFPRSPRYYVCQVNMEPVINQVGHLQVVGKFRSILHYVMTFRGYLRAKKT